jgi:hypothetical protein
MKRRRAPWLAIAVAAVGFALIAAVPVAPTASADPRGCVPQHDGDGQICGDGGERITIHVFCDPKPCPTPPPTREPEQP